jgi:alkyl hydroperoxide reductase subunit AhpF
VIVFLPQRSAATFTKKIMAEIFDIIIIGGGPAGLTAGIYASRTRMKT